MMDRYDLTWFPMSEHNPARFDVSAIERRFDRAAQGFGGADFVHRHTFDGLLERSLPMTLQPATIIDLGCAAGAGSVALSRAFRRARVVSVDLSERMLQQAAASGSWFSRRRQVRGNACRLPFSSDCADLVVANLLLPWLEDPPAALSEINRVLRPDGLFMFSSLGPSSFDVIRDAWKVAGDEVHGSPFADMHDVGDALVQAGLRDPVLDVDQLSVTYRSARALFDDLTATGARNVLASRRSGLTGKARFRRFERALEDSAEDGQIVVRLELVYGHAWGGQAVQDPVEFRLSPSSIGVRRR